MSKYCVNITMSITEVGAKEPMSVTTQDYHNMEYFEIVGVQNAVVTSLLDLGKAAIDIKK